MHTIAADEIAIVYLHGLNGMIGPQPILDTQGACEDVCGSRRPQRVVRGQQRKLVVAQPVDSRVPNMEQMRPTAAQNQCTQGAGHAVEVRIGSAGRMEPAIHGIGGPGADSSHPHCDRLPDAALDEPPHTELGGGSPPFCATHAICQRGDEAERRLPRGLPDITGREILVPLTPTLQGVAADPDMQAHVWCSRSPRAQF
jgi:hypothetical protein